jgi:S-ribosylhomocysteine lyase
MNKPDNDFSENDWSLLFASIHGDEWKQIKEDEFKRHSTLEAFKSEYTGFIDTLNYNDFFILVIRSEIGEYNFTSSSFPLEALSQGSSYITHPNNYNLTKISGYGSINRNISLAVLVKIDHDGVNSEGKIKELGIENEYIILDPIFSSPLFKQPFPYSIIEGNRRLTMKDEMERIGSFSVDHNKLKRGVYVSRIDEVGSEKITSYDIRIKRPNREPVLDIAILHSIEHLGATFLRNHKVWTDKTIYFGPMGCRTGCYLLLKGDLPSGEIVDLLTEMFRFIADFEGKIPGASAVECGHHLSMDLPMAKYESAKYLKEVLENIDESRLVYPE